MSEKVYNVLVLCTGNSARGIMAEALINTMGTTAFVPTAPAVSRAVNPFAIEQVATTGYPLGQLRSKSWNEFAKPDAPAMGFVITV